MGGGGEEEYSLHLLRSITLLRIKADEGTNISTCVRVYSLPKNVATVFARVILATSFKRSGVESISYLNFTNVNVKTKLFCIKLQHNEEKYGKMRL